MAFFPHLGHGQLGPIIHVSGRKRLIFINISVIFMPVIGLSMADVRVRQHPIAGGQMLHI